MSEDRELDYPCVAKRPDGSTDYWAVQDSGSPLDDDAAARRLVDEVCDVAIGEGAPTLEDLDTLFFILRAAAAAADDRAHPGSGVGDAYVHAFLERAVTCEPAMTLTAHDAVRIGKEMGP